MIATEQDIHILRECGARLAKIIETIQAALRPRISTHALDELAEGLIAENGGSPAFKGYRMSVAERPYPASICTSINDEVVHGIPRPDRVLSNGDILGLDIGMRYPARAGLVTDMAVTVAVGSITPAAEKLLRVTEEALTAGIRMVRAGIRLGDVGETIQRHIERQGFSVVQELVGHGVGKHLHEDPHVPNYGKAGEGRIIPEHMVLAIEPMATIGSAAVVLDRDGWTWRTRDGSLAAHFEHTVVVTREGAEILTRLR